MPDSSTEATHQPSLPAPLRLRPVMWEDIPACLLLFNRCSQAEIGVAAFTESEIRSEWSAPNYDPAVNARLRCMAAAIV